MKKRLITMAFFMVVLTLGFYSILARFMIISVIAVTGIKEWQDCQKSQYPMLERLWPMALWATLGLWFYFYCSNAHSKWLVALVLANMNIILVSLIPRMKNGIGLKLSVLPWVFQSALYISFLVQSPWDFFKLQFIISGFDSLCYVFGRAFGRHLIMPSISPKKTYEGFIGGWLWVFITLMFFVGLWQAIAWSIPVSLACFYGDIFASWYKRKLSIKDFSSLFPGHGGMMDRFDSLILAIPLLFVILSI